MTYTLWDTETRNVVAWFGTEGEVLAAVRETLREDGREAAETCSSRAKTAPARRP